MSYYCYGDDERENNNNNKKFVRINMSFIMTYRLNLPEVYKNLKQETERVPSFSLKCFYVR